MSSPVSYDLQGQGGGIVLEAGGTVSDVGVIRWVQCLADCVFNDFQSSNLQDSNLIQGVIIPAGVGIGGKIGPLELTSGLAIAYYI